MGSIGGLQIGHQHTSGGFEKKSLILHLLNKIKKISQQFEVENSSRVSEFGAIFFRDLLISSVISAESKENWWVKSVEARVKSALIVVPGSNSCCMPAVNALYQ